MTRWLLAFLVVIICGPVLAEQYRSKLLMNPEQALGESVELSVEELEQQFDGIEDQYARSSAGRHLAHHYVQQQQYGKAVLYYQQALAANGLSEILNRQMSVELAKIYLLMKQPQQTITTLRTIALPHKINDADVALLYAKAYVDMKQYTKASDTLDQALVAAESPSETFYKQVLAIAYHIDRFDQCELALLKLIGLDEEEPQYWFQLATVYVKQGNQKQALSMLILAQKRGFSFSEQSLLLMCDLYAAQNAPYQAALIMEQAIDHKRLSASAANYRRLFEYQLQAQEHELALQSLAKAARASGDAQLYFYWAKLLKEREQWQAMHDVILEACTRAINKKTVGEANLLLGISELKLGMRNQAKSSFENASLVGGVNELAGQWLRFMGEASVGRLSKSRISGPCQVNSR